MTSQTTTAGSGLDRQLLAQIEVIVQLAETETKPLELDPYRSQLFELFVTAHGAGYLDDGAEVDLTADELCRTLAQRWKLDVTAQEQVSRQEKFDNQTLGRMRLLWSLMRMWMEWTYAWQRWEEFHAATAGDPRPVD